MIFSRGRVFIQKFGSSERIEIGIRDGGLYVDDIAALEDIVREIILYKPFREIYLYILLCRLFILLILYFERIQVKSALFRAPGLV